jgi:PGF-CTERM protein
LFTIKVLETTIEPTIPASTPKPSPGFGIVVAIVVVVSAIYIRGKRR